MDSPPTPFSPDLTTTSIPVLAPKPSETGECRSPRMTACSSAMPDLGSTGMLKPPHLGTRTDAIETRPPRLEVVNHHYLLKCPQNFHGDREQRFDDDQQSCLYTRHPNPQISTERVDMTCAPNLYNDGATRCARDRGRTCNDQNSTRLPNNASKERRCAEWVATHCGARAIRRDRFCSNISRRRVPIRWMVSTTGWNWFWPTFRDQF